MGATVTAPTQTAHPIKNPARLPKEKCGYRVDPPATGYMLPSSAWTSARTSITRAPSIQDINAARPAICEAYRAPKSHPDPMIDPSETNISPRGLTSLLSWRPTTPFAGVAIHLLWQSDPYVAEGYRNGTGRPGLTSTKRSELERGRVSLIAVIGLRAPSIRVQ